jgi:molybdopterin synthase sulfur carrier subunit
MAVTVRVPTALRSFTGGQAEIDVEPGTVGSVLDALDAAHPGFKDRLTDGDGKLKRFVNVFLADDDVRYLQGLDTPVAEGQTVSIVPAVAGGLH